MVDTIDRPAIDAALPFGMKPAPQRKAKTIGPVDLGDIDPEYRGWMVVFDGDLDWSVFADLQARVAELQTRISAKRDTGDTGEGAADAADDGSDTAEANDTPDTSAGLAADLKAMGAVMAEMTALMCYAWNFVDNITGALLPQPRDGGAARLSMGQYSLIAQAYSAAQQSPKAFGRKSKRRS